MEFNEKLQELRKNRNLTQEQLAEQLYKDLATVLKWCKNTFQSGLEILLQIANALEVDVKDLLNSSLDESIQTVRFVK